MIAISEFRTFLRNSVATWVPELFFGGIRTRLPLTSDLECTAAANNPQYSYSIAADEEEEWTTEEAS